MTTIVTPLRQVIFFSVFVDKKLAYTKYNFNFNLYCDDFKLPLVKNDNDKLSIFSHFLNKNVCYFNQPYTVLPELTKYFLPMTQEIIDYMNKYGYWNHPGYMTIKPLETYISTITSQFDLVYFDFGFPIQYPIEEFHRFMGDPWYYELTRALKFHPRFDELARNYLIMSGLNRSYFSIHVRRGDYITKCEPLVNTTAFSKCWQTNAYLRQFLLQNFEIK